MAPKLLMTLLFVFHHCDNTLEKINLRGRQLLWLTASRDFSPQLDDLLLLNLCFSRADYIMVE
jgi:hypothetical protein